jgi:hypothetical protein
VVHSTIAAAIVAASYFYVSTSEAIADKYRELFMYMGFAMVLGTFGIALTAGGAQTLAIVMWGNAIVLALVLFVKMIYFVGEVLISLMNK